VPAKRIFEWFHRRIQAARTQGDRAAVWQALAIATCAVASAGYALAHRSHVDVSQVHVAQSALDSLSSETAAVDTIARRDKLPARLVFWHAQQLRDQVERVRTRLERPPASDAAEPPRARAVIHAAQLDARLRELQRSQTARP